MTDREKLARELCCVYFSDERFQQEFSNHSIYDNWRKLADHVLKREIEARIDEIHLSGFCGLNSTYRNKRIAELEKQLEELNGQKNR